MPGNKQTIGFLLLPGFPMACLTSAIEPLRAANEIAGQEAFDWALVTETGEGAEASARIAFQADLALEHAGELNALLLLSGPNGSFANVHRSNGYLRRFARHGMVMGAVSGGVFPLARSGLLDARRASVHWCYKAAFQSEFPRLAISDDVLVQDRDLLTASGAAAAFDLMLGLIEARLGKHVMTEVACWFQHPLVRSQGVSQRIPSFRQDRPVDALPKPVSLAVGIFADRLDQPISVRDVAEEIGMSARQLERLFKTATGQSPALYFRAMRMRAARQLVMYSRDSFGMIAQTVGYASSATLSSYYQEAFGVTPQEDRRRTNLFRVAENAPIPSV